MRGSDAIEEAIRGLAARQHGLAARRQLLRLGLGDDAIDHRARALDEHPARPGCRALTALLDDLRTHGTPHTRSDLEAAMLQLCLDHRLPRPQVNRHDGDREVDFRWPGQQLVVEVDGRAYHRTRAAFDGDRARDRALLRAGWRVARFSDRRLHGDPLAVAQELTALIENRQGS